MSDAGSGEEVVAPITSNVLPKDVLSEIGTVKLFNKWSYEDVEIRDISLTWVKWTTRDQQLSKLTSAIAITFRSDRQSIYLIPRADMLRRDSERLNARLSSD